MKQIKIITASEIVSLEQSINGYLKELSNDVSITNVKIGNLNIFEDGVAIIIEYEIFDA